MPAHDPGTAWEGCVGIVLSHFQLTRTLLNLTVEIPANTTHGMKGKGFLTEHREGRVSS